MCRFIDHLWCKLCPILQYKDNKIRSNSKLISMKSLSLHRINHPSPPPPHHPRTLSEPMDPITPMSPMLRRLYAYRVIQRSEATWGSQTFPVILYLQKQSEDSELSLSSQTNRSSKGQRLLTVIGANDTVRDVNPLYSLCTISNSSLGVRACI